MGANGLRGGDRRESRIDAPDERRVVRALRRRARHLALRAYQPWALRVIAHDRITTIAGARIEVPVGVFHPGLLFSSTRFVARQLDQVSMDGVSLLEVGCGAGLISVLAAQRGAQVTALDINAAAVQCTLANARCNGVVVEAVVSDLFDALAPRPFDIVVVTPPYFQADPIDDAARAWFAGANFQYYRRLFAGIDSFVGPSTLAVIGQGEDSDVAAIGAIAAQSGLRLELWASKVLWFDQQKLYRIVVA
jgi:release factor glutamine methyltransferase